MQLEHSLAEFFRKPYQPINVLVVGAGGNGSAIFLHLPYLHQALRVWGHAGLNVTIVDGDEVSETNCVRQPFALADVGLNKAVVLANRVNLFWGLRWRAVPEQFCRNFLDYHNDQTHLLISCVDIHTYYAASTPECADMESVLHEILLSPPGVLDVSELQYYHLAQVTLTDPLTYVSFHTPYLPQLGLTRTELIDSLPGCYPETRPWAEAAYQQQPRSQAIGYGSRRDDSARCLILFEQRLPSPPISVLKTEALALPPRRQEVLALVRRLKIREI